MASDHDLEGVVVAHHDEEEETLAPDEPRTPGWMPLLGGSLFLCAAIFFVATQPAGKTGQELAQQAAAAAAEAAAKAQPPAPEPGAQQPAQPAGQPGQPAQGG